MGSSFAAVKAGIIAGVFFAGAVGVFNYLLLVVLKASVLAYLATTPECSGVVPTNSTHPLEDCYQATVSDLVPFEVFVIFIIVLFFAFLFGRFFERIPGRGYHVKAAIISYVMTAVLVLTGFEGISTNQAQTLYLIAFEVAAAGGFAYLLGTFYRRYTRVVEFSSPDPQPVKIIVGRRNVTGKTATFSARSSHKVVAEAPGNRVFKEWSFSGGVTVEDPRSYETVMRVDGDGLLRAYSTTPS